MNEAGRLFKETPSVQKERKSPLCAMPDITFILDTIINLIHRVCKNRYTVIENKTCAQNVFQ